MNDTEAFQKMKATPPSGTCVFHATISSGSFKGESFVCGAPAVGDYYDRLYKCRRKVCKRHANVVNKNHAKNGVGEGVTFFK